MKRKNDKLVRLFKKSVSDKEFKQVYNSLSFHELDLLVPCPNKDCLAKEGYECKRVPDKIVHFGRRVKRLLHLPPAVQ